MKKYRKNHTARIPARGAAETRHLSARSGLEVLYYQMVQSLLVQRERRNDLPELTPQRAQELFEAWRRGEMADVQLMWDQLEERDDTLMVVLNARLSALAEMPWALVVDADAVGDDPQRKALAEEQKRYLSACFAAVENLDDALRHLGMADFRGVAALEITGNTTRMRWEVIEPWNLCRPVRRGPWLYNEEASATPARLEELEPERVIVREAMPIDLPAMYLISSLHHSVHSWDGFLEVFGIPNIFMEMPPGTTEEAAAAMDAVAQRLIGEGRGTVPSGTKFQTVETSKDNSQSFEARYKVCREAIITLATGGLLTVGTAPDSGTLAGNAHSDSFSRLCAASARSISAAINRQFVRPLLAARYEHEPVLVQFELAPEPVDDRLQMAQLLSALNTAGWAPSAETVSEMMRFEVERVQATAAGAPMVQNMQHTPITNTAGGAVEDFSTTGHDEPNSTTDRDARAPLSSGELAALRMLGGELNAAQVAADAEFMSREMLNALEDTTPEDSEDIENRLYARESNGQFAETGAGQHSHKGGRSSKGTPKRQATKSNIPQKAAVAVKLDVLNILVDKATPTSTRQILEKKGANSMKYENGNKVGKPKLGAVAPGMKTEFYVTGGSVDELLAGKHVNRSADKKSHYMAAAYVNELWERSEPLDKYRDRKKPYKESDIEWMHKRTARMRLGKDLYSVEITAKEMKNPATTPNRLYQIKTRRIEE